MSDLTILTSKYKYVAIYTIIIQCTYDVYALHILYNTCVIFLGRHYIENIIFSTDIMENAYPNVTLGTWLHGSTVTHSIKMLRNIYPTL